MRMTINQMRIQNFKATRDAVINFGERTHISGMNGSGKTTIPDAFSWLLFNKDSRGNAPGSDNFREKPLDADGNEIHNLDTTVEIICTLDGKPFNLRRTQRENWVKKRGRIDSTYQGNVSTYWINEVEVKQADFKARISQIASDEVFRLIASLSAFNALEWKKRREQLISLSGMDVDGALLGKPEYAPILEEINQRGVGVDDLKKILTDQRRRTNEELKMIPVRIDEARNSIPAVSDQQAKDAEYIIKDYQASLESVETMIAAEKISSGSGDMAQKIDDLRSSVSRMKNEVTEAHLSAIGVAMKEAGAAKTQYEAALTQYNTGEMLLERDRRILAGTIAERNDLRAEYSKEYAAKYDTASDNCPTCGQKLPDEMIVQAMAQFEAAKRERLSRIQERGKAAAWEVERLEKSVAEKEAASASEKEKLDTLAAAMNSAIDALDAIREKEPDFSSNPRIAELEAEIERLEQEAATPAEDKIAALKERKADLKENITRATDILLQWESGNRSKARIAELEKQQHEAGERVARVEQLFGLLEQFVLDRCSALEESINEKFPTLRWKLFDTQINGGIVDVCVATIECDGAYVPYEAANTASQVKADLEIIEVLSKHYDVSLPLFVDNSERVNRIAPTQTQLVTLSVSNDPVLKIEKEA